MCVPVPIIDDTVVQTYDERGPFKVLTLEDIVSNVLSVAERMSSDATCSHTLYLSFFLHGQNFWRIKFAPKNANFCQFLPIYTKKRQFSPIFRVKSVKIYTGQKNLH